MTKEEAVKEIEKAFEPAFANYIITALTEGATVSDIQHRLGRAYETGVKGGLEQEPKWIPVTERLPDKLTNVNIAFDDCPNEYDVAYLRTTVNETYRKNGAENEWVSLMGEATYADYEVSAWMEIKPYKAESEVEDGKA